MKYIMTVDKLKFQASSSLQLNKFFNNGICRLNKNLILVATNKFYNQKVTYPYEFNIQFYNQVVGCLFAKTLNLKEYSGLNILIEMENQIFYQRNFKSVLEIIISKFKITGTKISRLDIAYDTDTDVLTLFKTLYYDSTIELTSRAKIKASGAKDEMIPIGSLKSKKRSGMIYNKTLELKSSNKEYIRNFHRRNLGYTEIYRVELRLFTRLPEISEIKIINLASQAYLESIYLTHIENLISFQQKVSKKKVAFIKFGGVSQKMKLNKKSKTTGVSIKHIKGIINFMDRECYTTELRNANEKWRDIRTILLKKYGLAIWGQEKK